MWLNAQEITEEEKHDVLDMVLHVEADHPKKRFKNGSFSPQKWTTVWHHGVGYPLLNTHLQSFDRSNTMEEERPSLETPISHTGDRPELSGRTS